MGGPTPNPTIPSALGFGFNPSPKLEGIVGGIEIGRGEIDG